jgi:undecaprenyl-diphosphatase
MIERLLEWDENAFLAVNRGLANPFFDFICVPARNPTTWIPVYVFFVLFLTINFKKEGFKIVGLVILTFIVTDQLSGHIIKPMFARVRPCNDDYLAEMVRMLVPCGSGYSFTSNHASNHFGISFILTPFFFRIRKWTIIPLLMWPILVSFSQIYVGLHYPIDVFGGMLVGLISSTLVYFIFRKKISLIV